MNFMKLNHNQTWFTLFVRSYKCIQELFQQLWCKMSPSNKRQTLIFSILGHFFTFSLIFISIHLWILISLCIINKPRVSALIWHLFDLFRARTGEDMHDFSVARALKYGCHGNRFKIPLKLKIKNQTPLHFV